MYMYGNPGALEVILSLNCMSETMWSNLDCRLGKNVNLIPRTGKTLLKRVSNIKWSAKNPIIPFVYTSISSFCCIQERLNVLIAIIMSFYAIWESACLILVIKSIFDIFLSFRVIIFTCVAIATITVLLAPFLSVSFSCWFTFEQTHYFTSELTSLINSN